MQRTSTLRATEDPAVTEEQGSSRVGHHGGTAPADRVLTRWLLGLLVATILVSIGTPLLGLRVFSGADLLLQYAPWNADAPLGYRAGNNLVSDTVDAILPMRAELRRELAQGNFPLWTTLPTGGTALGAVPHVGPLSPLNLPYLTVPLWYAPALSKLLEMAAAAALTYLFLRRIDLSRPAAVVGALVFINSGFQVVWTNWPQSHVGALIPGLFWGVERAMAERTVRSALPLAVVTAVMLFEGFPAVTAFGLLFAGVYTLVRLWARWREGLAPVEGARALALVGGAVALGIVLTSIQLLPFLHQLRTIDTESRADRVLGQTIDTSALVTLAVPDAYGSPPDHRYFAPRSNYIEYQSFIGVTALALGVLAVARGRALRPARATRVFLLAAAALAVWLIYFGGPPLLALQSVPPFDINFIGRMRAVLGFLLACAAALGFQALLTDARPPGSWRAWAGEGVLWVLGLLALAGGMWWARGIAQAAGESPYYLTQLLVPLSAAALAAVALGWDATRGRPVARTVLVLPAALALPVGAVLFAQRFRALEPNLRADLQDGLQPALVAGVFGLVALALFAGVGRWGHHRRLVIAVLPVLIVVESLAFARPLWPRIPAEHFFPETTTHTFLADNLGHDSLAAENFTLFPGTTTYYGLRSVSGHAFTHPTWQDALLTVDPDVLSRSPTFSLLNHDLDIATSPLLDRLAARYYVASAHAPVFGETRAGGEPSGEVTLRTGSPVEAPVPDEPLRAVILTIAEPFFGPDPARLQVDLLDASGEVVGTGRKRIHGGGETGQFLLPVSEPQGVATSARLTLDAREGALVLGVDDQGHPVLDLVIGEDDGLRSVLADGAVVYERDGALPRLRWAGNAEVVADPERRLARLAAGEDGDTVVLSEPGPAASGETGKVAFLSDGADELVIEVAADGPGYVVVADAVQDGWTAWVNGEPAAIHDADHALGAVHVPAGTHEVRLAYVPPGWRLGMLVSAAALLLLLGLAGIGVWQHRRRPATASRDGQAPPVERAAGASTPATRPASGAGTPAEGAGRPEREAGRPAEGTGRPEREAGRPTSGAG